jgi:prepilin-type N-terminal cleavage/methylation domain-containing protein
MERMHARRLRGFTLVELAAVVAVFASMGAVMGPMLHGSRSSAQGVSSAMNLRAIGMSAGMYGQDHAGAIFTYTWEPGVPYVNLKNGKARVYANEAEASGAQAQNILQRATGRIDGVGGILLPNSRVMHRRFSHLVLADYMGGNVSDPVWVDPADGQLLDWQSDPLRYLEDNCGLANPVPYRDCDVLPGYDAIATWSETSVAQMWAFGSSYQLVPAAYLFDDRATYVPTTETPHLFTIAPGAGPTNDFVAQRFFDEVRSPTMKVMLFEEFDRERAQDTYFAYDEARPAKLMFDGSVNTLASGEARSGSNPQIFDFEGAPRPVEPWTQRYVPLDQFPVPLSGLGEDERLDQRYRWTFGGLQGVDYVRMFTGNGRR